MPQEILLSTTTSVCPECLQRIPAQRIAQGENVFLRKTCPEHGVHTVCIWQGPPTYQNWHSPALLAAPPVCTTTNNEGCPFDCGLCPQHRQQTCCVLLEVTSRCNLHCPFCFAASSAQTNSSDPSLDIIAGWYQTLMRSGGPYNIQLSGGEPTLRDDLPAIITLGKKLGFEFFQLNTNGLRLAEDEEYVSKLQKAGLNCVFLQFDGISDTVYTKLRGKALLAVKQKAIAVCTTYNLGVVLVPTLVPGVNDSQLGEIIQLATELMPTVRGVHLQPVSHFGRYPKSTAVQQHLTIPQILRAIEKQTNGQMQVADFHPSGGEHSHCSFHGDFVLQANGKLQPLRPQPAANTSSCCQSAHLSTKPSLEPVCNNGAARARKFVARQWSAAKAGKINAEQNATKQQNKQANNIFGDFSSLDQFLEQATNYRLTVSGMAFQDAWTLDLERLQQCFLHIMSPDGRIIPFAPTILPISKAEVYTESSHSHEQQYIYHN